MKRQHLLAAILLAVGLLFVQAEPVLAGSDVHRVAIHVDDNNKARMNMALNNAANINKYYQSKGEKVEIEIVAYGPGLHMFRADTSPVKQRIAAMSLELDNLKFSACGNTHKRMSKKGKVALISEAKMVPSGIVRLIELQEKGWAYVRP
jgi:uncharacterized protein